MSKSISKYLTVVAVAIIALGTASSAYALTPADEAANQKIQQQLQTLQSTVNKVQPPATSQRPLTKVPNTALGNPTVSNFPTTIQGIAGTVTTGQPIATTVATPNQIAQANAAINTINQISNLNGQTVLNNAQRVAQQQAIRALENQLGTQLSGLGNLSNLPGTLKRQLSGAVNRLPGQIASNLIGRISGLGGLGGLGGLFGGSKGAQIGAKSARLREILTGTSELHRTGTSEQHSTAVYFLKPAARQIAAKLPSKATSTIGTATGILNKVRTTPAQLTPEVAAYYAQGNL